MGEGVVPDPRPALLIWSQHGCQKGAETFTSLQCGVRAEVTADTWSLPTNFLAGYHFQVT